MFTNRTPRIVAVIGVVAAAPILLAAARGTSPAVQPPVSTATTIIVRMTGAKQGPFKAAQVTKTPGDIPGFGFQFELHSPRDPATGLPMGKRQYTPITFTKELGAASPQIFQALNSNELLTTVEFDFVRSGTMGQQAVYYTVKLTNATVTSVRSYISAAPDQRALEDVSFTFQKIEIEDKEGKTSAMDDWQSRT